MAATRSWPRAAREAWKAPELPVLLFVGLLGTLLLLSQNPVLRDLDVGWLVRYGEMIWDRGGLPETDVFSFTQAGRKWTLYQWGFQAYIGGLHRLAGLGGVVWGTALIIAATYALLLYLLLNLGLNRLLSIGLVILAMLTSSHYWLARPGTCNFLLYLLVLMLLEDYRRAPRHQLWGLPPIFILWANLHIGFVVGLMTVFLYGLWAALVPTVFRGPGTARDFLVLLILPLCAAALCLNPYGVKIFPYVKNATSSSFLNDNIVELQSPNFHNAVHLFFFAQLILAIWLGVGVYPARSLFLALFTVTLFMGLYSGRHLTFFSITATIVLAQILICCWGWQAPGPCPRPSQGWAWAGVGALFSLLLVIGMPRWGPVHYDFDPKLVPRGAAAFLKSRENGTRPWRVFSLDDQWASYLIYELSPRVLVYLDTRFDFYGEDFIRETVKLQNQALYQPQVLNPLGVDFLLVKKEKLLHRPETSPEWALAYEDDQAILYRHVPAVPPAAGPAFGPARK